MAGVISLLVPSRGRPESFKEMVRSAYDNADSPSLVEVVARLDDDDPAKDDYQFPHIEGPRSTLSGLWNDAAVVAEGSLLMQCADDIRFRTKGWDHYVREAWSQYPDGIFYLYGRDGIADERMATHGFMHRRWYEALGYFTWPHFSSDYGDLWNHTIAERLDRLHYIPELYTEHLHPAAGKGELDQTHLDRIERDKGGVNAAIWEQALPDLDAAVSVLAELLHPQLPINPRQDD